MSMRQSQPGVDCPPVQSTDAPTCRSTSHCRLNHQDGRMLMDGYDGRDGIAVAAIVVGLEEDCEGMALVHEELAKDMGAAEAHSDRGDGGGAGTWRVYLKIGRVEESSEQAESASKLSVADSRRCQ